MENQSSSDGELTNVEKPSISLDGLLRTGEIPNLKELFRDENLGVCGVHVLDGKLIIHSQLFGEPTKDRLARAREASIAVDEAFRARGVKEIYTWAETDEQYRYNLFLGFKPTEKEVVFDPPRENAVYEFVKEL